MRLTRSKGIAVMLGVIAVAYAVTATGEEREPAHVTQPALENVELVRQDVQVRNGAASPATSSPASLSGTDPDGDLTVTVSRGTIRLFDYYLTTLGETDLAGVRALVAAEVERQSPANATEVIALFDRYTTYLEELHDVHALTIDSYLAQMQALQQRHFGADTETLFGEDNALAARLLASAAKSSTSLP